MKVVEAFEEMQDGFNVRSVKWPKDISMKISKDGQFVFDTNQNKYELASLTLLLYSALDDEWEIYEEKKILIPFSQVIEGWSKGKKYKRTSHGHPIYVSGGELVFLNTYPYSLNIDDLVATDWHECK